LLISNKYGRAARLHSIESWLWFFTDHMLCCACLEAHVDLEIEHVVVRFCQFAVVYKHILCVELYVLAKTIVGANLMPAQAHGQKTERP